jgi:probable HAF family extracellular repeat protein
MDDSKATDPRSGGCLASLALVAVMSGGVTFSAGCAGQPTDQSQRGNGLDASRVATDASSVVVDGGVPFVEMGPGRCYGVSRDGHVVGTTDTSPGSPFVMDSAGNRTSLPLYQNDGSTVPFAINVAGQIVGLAQSPRTAILYQNGSWTSIPPPPGEQWNAALDIDEAGDVVGVGTQVPDSAMQVSVLHAFYRPAGQATVDLSLAVQSSAYRISNACTIAGIFETDAGATHGFLRPAAGGSLLDLGTLGGPNSSVYAVNASGNAVGVSDTAAAAHHAFLFTSGRMMDLGTLGGSVSEAKGIDDEGHVVGNGTTSTGVAHPFVVRGGTLVDMLPGVSTASSYTMARVEMVVSGLAVGWGLAPDNSTHCIKWPVAP